MDQQTLVIFSTIPDQATAKNIACALVGEHLAACVNILPGLESVYRWQGAIEDAPEVLAIIKTTADRYPALANRLRELHPYEVPEIVALPVDRGYPPYLRWVAEAVNPAPSSAPS